MNKTNQETLDDIKKKAEVNARKGVVIKVPESYFNFLFSEFLKALEAKDTEAVLAVEIATRNMEEAHRKEMIEMLKELKSKGVKLQSYINDEYKIVIDADDIDEKLTQLKSND